MTDLTLSISLLAVIFAMVAFFYASVGLGGGSSYTALLVIFGAGGATIPMVSLTLNVLVTTVGSIVFLSQKHARLRLIAPFLITSIPAMRIYFPKKTKPLELDDQAKFFLALGCGSVLGLIAGIVGIGGGVYLVPLILILGLGTAKEAAACGAFFIWVNSVAGLAARLQYNSIDLVPYMPLIIGAVIGGLVGSILGAGRFEPRTMQKILGTVLVVAIFFLGRKIAITMM
jgi:uncharacterized membrane protein YfcA